MKVASFAMPISRRPAAPERSDEQPQPRPTSLGETVYDSVETVLNTYRAMPQFLYPSVYGTAAERSLIMNTLDSLPLKDVGSTVTITMKDTLGSANLLGVNRPALGSIAINRTGYGMSDPAEVVETLVHELGHSKDYPGRIPSILTGGHSGSGPFGSPPYVSRYAGTAAAEDFAESYATYRLDPDRLREVAPEKYAVFEKLNQKNFIESFLDQPAFRETGKLVGESLGKVPYLRWGLSFASQISMVNLAASGVQDVFSGHAVRGGLATGAAAALAFSHAHPLLGPAAMTLLGAHRGLQMAESRGAGAAGQALASVGAGTGGLVGGYVAPLGLTLVGHSLAGPVGGAVGLAVGALAGQALGTELGGRAGLALGASIDQAMAKS
ncbi:MAG: hypothetical protein AB7S38_35930 [Vulcanimicrobiota bacterium]